MAFAGRLFWVCVAGALGTGSRYLVSLWAGRALGTAFPYGTLFANLLGCFLLALVMRISLDTALVSPTLRLALTTGFMGGLTTYSSFNYETLSLLQGRAWQEAGVNLGVTVLGCFLAGVLGLVAAGWLIGAAR